MKLLFQEATLESTLKKISVEKGVYNFLNLYSVYLFKNKKVFRNSVLGTYAGHQLVLERFIN